MKKCPMIRFNNMYALIILGVTSFNGYNSCLKCVVKGKYSYQSNTVIFTDLNAALRTDSEFRKHSYNGHQKFRTILEDLPIDMIADFPIADALHIIDLGVTKRLLHGFKFGSLSNYDAKWSIEQRSQVSKYLVECQMPSEIHRQVRGLEDLPHWKGTEYRTFLLYISLVIFNKFVEKKQLFEHFLLYFCSIHICSRSDQCEKNYDVAKAMLKEYLEKFKSIYGIHHFTSNLHNLIHLVDDVMRFGPLGNFDAYPFESRLFYLKRLLRTGVNPLQQVARRITEAQSANCFRPSTETRKFQVKNILRNFDSEDLSFVQFISSQNANIYSRIEFKQFILDVFQDKNRWILSKSNEIVCIKYIICTSVDSFFLYGSPLKSISDYFLKPVKSSRLNIFQSNCEMGAPKYFSIGDIHSKLVKVEYSHPTYIFVPLIHTIDTVK